MILYIFNEYQWLAEALIYRIYSYLILSDYSRMKGIYRITRSCVAGCWTGMPLDDLAAKVELLYAQEATERCASVLDLEAVPQCSCKFHQIALVHLICIHLQSAKRWRSRWTFSVFDQTSATYVVELFGLFRALQVESSVDALASVQRNEELALWRISGCKFK